MGTKQLRLNDHEQIKIRIGSFLGKKINIVLLDNTVTFGVLKEVTKTEILLTNMRLKEKRYRLSMIAEIYIDTIV